jgi:hypothetical protein
MRALVTLSMLQAGALARRVGRTLKSVKGALLFAFGFAVVTLWLAPSVWQAMVMPRTDPRVVLEWGPVFLLASVILTVVTSGGDKAITFTPAEVDFLFSGPFTRRQLLTYKLAKSAGGILFSSLLLSFVLLRHARSWPAAFLGLTFAMLFLQMVGVASTLVGQSVGERAYTRGRRVVLAVAVVAALAWLVPTLAAGGGPTGRPAFDGLVKSLRGSTVGSVILAPLDVFPRLFVTGAWWPAGLRDAGLALAMNAALITLVYALDADYLEAAAARSQATYERMRRLRQGGIGAAAGIPSKSRWAMPRLPYWGGAGPVAWRQGTTALRNSRNLLLILLLVTIAVGPVVLMAHRERGAAAGSVVGAMAWMTLLVGAWLRFDFRGDLDQMDHLKSLPASAWAISAGQLAAPTVLMTLCHGLIVASAVAATRRLDPVLLIAAAVSLPFNAMLFAVENLIFLLVPTRATANPTDFQGYGRQILVLFVKGVIVLVAGGLAGLAGLLAYKLTGSWGATATAAAITLTAEAAALVPLVAVAFDRFDVSRDTPA